MTAPQRSVLTLKREPREKKTNALEERLHKVLAHAGLGSRRMLEKRIQMGEVHVNGNAAPTGSSVCAGDRIIVDGKQYVVCTKRDEQTEVLLYHKPEGVITTRDDTEGRSTVFEQLPHLKGARWVTVGRLDINTSGLLLLTTDGELANALAHPKNGLEREYLCRIHGNVSDQAIETLKAGVELEDGPGHFEHITVINQNNNHTWLRVVICEGRNREVRRLWNSQGYMVSRLKRVRYGHIELPRHLRHGHYEVLDDKAIKELRQASGLCAPQPALTLCPVLHQRRTNRRNLTEYRPKNNSASAWSGAYLDEARELRAFDRITNEEPARYGKKPRRHGKMANGNIARSTPPNLRRHHKKGVAPGQELPSVRTWFAGEHHGGSQAAGTQYKSKGNSRLSSRRGQGKRPLNLGSRPLRASRGNHGSGNR